MLCQAPYGYRYISKREGDGEARYDLVLHEVHVVRNLFRWVAIEGLSLGDAARRLTKQNAPTSQRLALLEPQHLAANLAQSGLLWRAALGQDTASGTFARTIDLLAAIRRRRVGRKSRGRPSTERTRGDPRTSTHRSRPVRCSGQERLDENRQRQRTRQNGPSFLLSGLFWFAIAAARPISARQPPEPIRSSVRVLPLHWNRKASSWGRSVVRQPRCAPGGLGRASLEGRLRTLCATPNASAPNCNAGYKRRRQPKKAEAESLRRSIRRAKTSKRVGSPTCTKNGYLDKDEFTDRAKRVKVRVRARAKSVRRATPGEPTIPKKTAKFSRTSREFAYDIRGKIDNADFKTKRTILSLLIKKIKLGADTTHIVYKVDTRPFAQGPEKGRLPHCNRRLCAAERGPPRSGAFHRHSTAFDIPSSALRSAKPPRRG